MPNYTKEYRNKQEELGMVHVNPMVWSNGHRSKVIAEAKRMRQACGISTSNIAVAKRAGPAKYPKRVRVWVPTDDKKDLLKYAKALKT